MFLFLSSCFLNVYVLCRDTGIKFIIVIRMEENHIRFLIPLRNFMWYVFFQNEQVGGRSSLQQEQSPQEKSKIQSVCILFSLYPDRINLHYITWVIYLQIRSKLMRYANSIITRCEDKSSAVEVSKAMMFMMTFIIEIVTKMEIENVCTQCNKKTCDPSYRFLVFPKMGDF